MTRSIEILVDNIQWVNPGNGRHPLHDRTVLVSVLRYEECNGGSSVFVKGKLHGQDQVPTDLNLIVPVDHARFHAAMESAKTHGWDESPDCRTKSLSDVGPERPLSLLPASEQAAILTA